MSFETKSIAASAEPIISPTIRQAKKFLAKRILELMKEKGITEAKFSQKLGISRPSYEYMVSGEFNFTISLLVIIAEILDVKLDSLFIYFSLIEKP